MSALEIRTDKGINPQVLTPHLADVIGEGFQGMGHTGEAVIIYTAEPLTSEQDQQIRALIDAHDPNEKTPAQEQRAIVEQARADVESEDFSTLTAAIGTSNLDAGTKAALTKIVNLIQSLAIAGGYINPADVIEKAR